MTNSQGAPSSSWLVIEWDLDTLKQIEDQVAAEWALDLGQPLETGGLLLGTYFDDRICIAGFEPVSFAPPTAPSPVTRAGNRARGMTPRETAESAFAKRVRAHESRPERGRNMVGWYRSQGHGPPELEPEDSRLHAKYFPEPWQVALILAPTGNGGADAGFFFLGNRGLASGPAFDGTPFAIDMDTLRQVETDVLQGFQDQTHWGQEAGGLLLGEREDGRLHAHGMEPVACEHASGTGFVLSEPEQAAMTQSISRWDEEGLEAGGARVIGWYQSHVRGGTELADGALAFHERFFPEPWHIAMILRPYANGSADAAFFFRRTEADTHAKPGAAAKVTRKAAPEKEARYWKSSDLKRSAGPEPLAPEARPAPLPDPQVEVPVAAASLVAEAVGEAELAAPVAVNVAPALETVLAPEPMRPQVSSEWLKQIQREYEQVEEQPAKRSQWAVWAVLASLVVVSLGVLLYLRAQFAPSPAPVKSAAIVPLVAVSRDGHIELHWDPKTLGSLKQGKLEIRDAGVPIEMQLDAATLALGSYAYLAKGDVTAFRLHADKVDGSMVEGATTYVAPSIPVERAAEKPGDLVPPPVDFGKDPVREVSRERIQEQPLGTAIAKKKPGERERRRLSEKEFEQKRLEARRIEERRLAAQKNEARKPFVPPARNAAQPAVSMIVAPEVNGIQAQQVQRTGTLPPSTVAAGVPPPSPPPVAVAAAPKPRLDLGGRWAMQPGSYSRSPGLPSAIDISMRESDGSVQGTLEARYKAGSKNEKTSLLFSGKMVNGVARFPWSTKDGKSGHIEFMRVPNSPNSVEVVWYGSDNKQVFDEIVQKAK